ncbi:MAG: hypothetical protein L3J43_02195 [Sulfurovum sp.]|nr:hypothetical protein [Sulfurovum sp.]
MIKLNKVWLIMVLLGGVTYAQEHFQLDRMQNMREMEIAMSTIQKGFLYNNINVVKNGVNDLKKTASHTESFIKEGVSKKGINTLVYAKKETENITKLADEILLSFEKGDRYEAANGYLKILSKCLSCHQTIRSW